MNKIAVRKFIGDIVHAMIKIFPFFVRKDGIRILMYHSVPEIAQGPDPLEMTTPKDIFKRHIQWLKINGYSVISLNRAVEYLRSSDKLPKKTIVITFDDAFENFKYIALPILKEYNFCSTVFLMASYAGQRKAFDFYSAESDNYSLSYQNIKEIDPALVSWGSHSVSHKKMSELSAQELDKEARQSKELIEKNIGSGVDFFAYPYGSPDSFNGACVTALKDSGYIAACTSIFGINNKNTPIYALRRNRISWVDDEKELKKHLSGAYDWMRVAQYVNKFLNRSAAKK